MKDWTYAKHGGTRYPVQTGQTWKVGRHTFVCSDLLADQHIDKALQQVRPTLLYADPPWSQSNLNSFRTKASVQHASHDWKDVYRRLVSLVPPGTPIWVESGRREEDKVSLLLPGPVRATYPVTYYRRHPSRLHYSGDQPAPCNPSGLDDDDTPAMVMNAYPTGTVFDGCAGRGLTCRTAERVGWTAITNELSPWRMSAAMHSVAEISGATPKRIA